MIGSGCVEGAVERVGGDGGSMPLSQTGAEREFHRSGAHARRGFLAARGRQCLCYTVNL